MADYFYLINKNENDNHYIKNERWWFGGNCFAEVLGKNGRCPLQKGEKGFYNDFYDMGYEKYTLTSKECKEIGKLLEKEATRIAKKHKLDPYYQFLVDRSKDIAKRLQNVTEEDEFIAYWQ